MKSYKRLISLVLLVFILATGSLNTSAAQLVRTKLDQLGINVKYVLGYAGEEYHAWNLVQLNNQWYHLDTTWNDPVPDQGKVSNYSYFLKSDNQISTDHTWEYY